MSARLLTSLIAAVFSLNSYADLRESCEQLAKSKQAAGARIISAEWIDAGKRQSRGRQLELPAHCRVEAALNERISTVDKKTYAIGFELRLPSNWNGRFLVQGNGANDGNLVPALGMFGNNDEPAISEGFAVVSSDAGHRNDNSSLLSSNAFGFDPQARLDYGYQAHLSLTPVAKTIVENTYGKAPHHSYFVGCSNGGRHAMVAANRMPEHFDGFIAGNPGFNLPKAAVQHAWDMQALSKIETAKGGKIGNALSKDDMKLVANKILQACDSLDGVRDGMVNHLDACQSSFQFESLACSDEGQSCLGDDQIKALKTMFAGPRNRAGAPLYSDWPLDAGIAAADWRRWKLESPIAGLPFVAALGAGSLSSIFVTPPDPVAPSPNALLAYLLSFDFDRDAQKIYASQAPFKESAMSFMTPPDLAHFSELFKQDKKLIVYHGASDAVFSANDTRHWFETLSSNVGSKLSANARLYLVPGMNHCYGGPATDRFDMLGAMVKWVEEGVAPEAIIASANPANAELPADWSKERTRPLCPYPSYAKYSGKGDVESASSFVCE